jgi:hypothetical protein
MFKAFRPVTEIDAIIACYPRSGSTYLGKLFEQRTLRHAKKTHGVEISKTTTVIGIFRDPAESISSFISKSMTFPNIDTHIDSINMDSLIANHAHNYKNYLKFLIERADCLIDFSSFIKDPEGCIVSLSDFLQIEVVRLDDFIDDMQESEADSFVKTSKTLDSYQIVSNLVNQAHLEECQTLFGDAKKSLKRIF